MNKLFLDTASSSSADVTTRDAWMIEWGFENACTAAWTVNVNEIRVTGLALFQIVLRLI